MKREFVNMVLLALVMVELIIPGRVAYGVVSPLAEDRGSVGSDHKGRGLYNWKSILPESEFLRSESGESRKDRLEELLEKLERHEEANMVFYRQIRAEIGRLE